MKTADLSGAILDYHTARAEGVPAADLELRANGTLCVRNIRGTPGKIVAVQVLDYSTNWALSGPLVEKHGIAAVPFTAIRPDIPEDAPDEAFCDSEFWCAYCYGKGGHYIDTYPEDAAGAGDTPLIAICRAVVRAAFGDEVEDLPCV